MVNIITSKTRRASRWHRGSSGSTIESAVEEAANRPGATRQSVEREVWKHASGAGNQTDFAKKFETGIEAVKKHYLKPKPGVSIRQIDESSSDKRGDST